MKLLYEFYFFVKNHKKNYSILNLAAQLSYRVLLAFIPFIMLIYNFFSWFAQGLNDQVLESLKVLFPGFLDEMFNTAAANAAGPQTSHWANIVFGFFILYASVCAVRSLILTINKVMLIPEKRNYFLVWGLAVLYLVILVILILVVFYLYIFTQKISTSFFEYMNLSDIFIKFWQGFTLIYISAIIALLVTAIYMYTPSVRMSIFFALPGGVFVSLGWLSIIGLYEAFIKNHLQIESLFSSLEGPFSLIIVVYVFCIILTFGCVVNLFLLKKIGR